MKNKFLEKYPQLITLNTNQKVVMLIDYSTDLKKGAIGRIHQKDNVGTNVYWVLFDFVYHTYNGSVIGSGTYCLKYGIHFGVADE